MHQRRLTLLDSRQCVVSSCLFQKYSQPFSASTTHTTHHDDLEPKVLPGEAHKLQRHNPGHKLAAFFTGCPCMLALF